MSIVKILSRYRKDKKEIVKKIIWIEKFGFFEILIFVTYTFFSNLIVRYDADKTSRLSKIFLNFLNSFHLCKNFSPVKIFISASIREQMLNNLHTWGERFCIEYISDKPKSFKNMTKNFLSVLLKDRAGFMTIVEREIDYGKKVNKEHQEHIIYLQRHPVNAIIIPFYSEKGLKIKETLKFNESIKYHILPFYRIAHLLVGKIINQKVKSNIKKIISSIWIEYAHKDVVDFSFWRDVVNTEGFDIVYYLDRPDTPPIKDIMDTIESKKMKWIDVHTFSLIKIVSSNFNWMFLRELLSELFTKFNQPLWFRIFMLEYNFWYFFYRSIFEYFKVKILIQHQNNSWKQEVQARAIEDAGGIMMGLHWSNYQDNGTPLRLYPYHIFFVWGKLISDLIQRHHTSKYILPLGCWILHDNKIAQTITFSNKVSFVISIFDSSVAYNFDQTPDTLYLFYLRILQLLEDNPSWGMIVKSKNWNLKGFYSLPNGEDIVKRLELLINKKRAIVLDPVVSPTTASTLSNLAVCYGLNSAGIIAGIYGCRTIHWDCSGWLKHPFYKDPTQKFIYQSLKELEEAIISASKGDKSIGDFSKWRQKFNYFDDLNAPERVGRFIQDFMDEVIRTDDGKHSMDFAVKKYIEENGIKDDFFKMDNLWENE